MLVVFYILYWFVISIVSAQIDCRGNDLQCSAPGECCSGLCIANICKSPAPLFQCSIGQDICDTDEDCCSKVCIPEPGVCASSNKCRMFGEDCSDEWSVTTCCPQLNLTCHPVIQRCMPINAVLRTFNCHANGQPCQVFWQCCGQNCENSICTERVRYDRMCIQNYFRCNHLTECCSMKCDKYKQCIPMGIPCLQLGQECANADECCTQRCEGGICLRRQELLGIA